MRKLAFGGMPVKVRILRRSKRNNTKGSLLLKGCTAIVLLLKLTRGSIRCMAWRPCVLPLVSVHIQLGNDFAEEQACGNREVLLE